MTDNPPDIGYQTRAVHRDAIHIAVAPLMAGENLNPGDGFKNDDGVAMKAPFEIRDGVVDPFLRIPLKKGDRFWGFLKPGSITNLRHHWTHPSFREDKELWEDEEDHHAWLIKFAKKHGFDFHELLDIADECDPYCGGITKFGEFDDDWPEEKDLLFEHLESYLKRKIPQQNKDNIYFSCSC